MTQPTRSTSPGGIRHRWQAASIPRGHRLFVAKEPGGVSSHETEFERRGGGPRAQAADSIDVFELARADASALPRWQPGAHISLVLPSGDERQYSLASLAPTGCVDLRIAVLREPSGRGGSLSSAA
jgi:hypothetical protein